MVKIQPDSAGSTGDMGLIPRLGRSPREGNCNLFQYTFPENPMDRGAWEATDHGDIESNTTEHAHTHIYIHARQQKRLKYSLNTKTIKNKV